MAAGQVTVESYTALLQGAKLHLGALQKLGLKQGDPCVLQVTERQTHFHVLWGCVLGGIPVVTIAVPPKYEKESAVCNALQRTHSSTTRRPRVPLIHPPHPTCRTAPHCLPLPCLPPTSIVQKLVGVIGNLKAVHCMASPQNVMPLRQLLPEGVSVHDAALLDLQAPGIEPEVKTGDGARALQRPSPRVLPRQTVACLAAVQLSSTS